MKPKREEVRFLKVAWHEVGKNKEENVERNLVKTEKSLGGDGKWILRESQGGAGSGLSMIPLMGHKGKGREAVSDAGFQLSCV